TLNERGVRPQTFDRRRDRAPDMDEREQLRLRVALADGFEHLLASAHAREPVVNERDLPASGPPPPPPTCPSLSPPRRTDDSHENCVARSSPRRFRSLRSDSSVSTR